MKKWIAALTLVFSLALATPAAIAQDTATLSGEKELTLQQAYKLATESSRSLKQAELAVEQAEETKTLRSQQVTYIPSGSTPTQAGTTYTTAVAADISWQMAKKSKSVEEDKLYLSVVEKYNNLLAAKENLAYIQKYLRQCEAQDKVNHLSLTLGLTSSMQYNIYYYSFETSKAALENTKLALNKAYTEFNNLVGLGVNERPVLLDKPSFELAEIDDPEITISRILDADPTVWLKEQQANLAELQLDLYSFDVTTGQTYKVKQLDVDKAELSVQDTRSQMKQLMRTLYNSMQNVEESYKTKQQLANKAEQNLKMKKAMFEAGTISKIDLNQAELDAAKAQLDLSQLTYQYQSLKLSFEKPWASI